MGLRDTPIYTGPFWHSRVKDLVLKGDAIAVAITLYYPRRSYGYPIAAQITGLAPNKYIFNIEDKEQFRTPFRYLLHQRWPLAKDRLEKLSEAHPGKAIILLCYDPLGQPGQWCHRQLVAEFITEQLGVPVKEINGQRIPIQFSLPYKD